MTKADSPVQSLLAFYWRDQGLAISSDLLTHEEFLLNFIPTGDVERDVAAFLQGVGREDMADVYSEYGLPLRGLALAIRDNHREELANLKQGQRPIWATKYQRWAPEQRTFYGHLLELEAQVLSAIVNSDSQGRAA